MIFRLKMYDKFSVKNKVFLDVYKISKLPSGVNIIVIFDDVSANFIQSRCADT